MPSKSGDSTRKPTAIEQLASLSEKERTATQERLPDLDSFEAVMQAMDAELARSRTHNANNGKGKARQSSHPEADIEAAMEAELRASLEGDDSDDENDEADGNVDYIMIKNFLESFKSQGGLSGPVSNLAGRLQPGWTLPRDDK